VEADTVDGARWCTGWIVLAKSSWVFVVLAMSAYDGRRILFPLILAGDTSSVSFGVCGSILSHAFGSKCIAMGRASPMHHLYSVSCSGFVSLSSSSSSVR
jgi:hypothetical protein